MPAVILESENLPSRRSIADALAAIERFIGRACDEELNIFVWEHRFPHGPIAGLIAVLDDRRSLVVYLRTSASFAARCVANGSELLLSISHLQRARILADGSVSLHDGRHIRAVQFTPSSALRDETDLERKILQHVATMPEIDGEWYRNAKADFEDGTWSGPDIKAIDYSRLGGSNAPPAKQIARYLEERGDPALKRVSPTKIRETLQQSGIQVGRRHRSKTVLNFAII